MTGPGLTLSGRRVGVTGARKGTELATTLRRRGAIVVHGPTLAGDVAAPEAELRAMVDGLIDRPATLFAASTGMGMRLLADIAAEDGRDTALGEALDGAVVLARGAKARGGLARLRVTPDWTAPDELDRQVADELRRRAGPQDRVVVQGHGAAGRVYDQLDSAGLKVDVVRPYVSAPLADPATAGALVDAVVDTELDVVVFTSPGAVHGLQDVASGMGCQDAVGRALGADGPVAVAAVGPVTAGAVAEYGWTSTIVPDVHRTGALVRALEQWAARG